MSKFNKCGLALAVAGAFALPVSAFAASAGYPDGTTAAQITFASNLFGANSSTISNPVAYSIRTQSTDNIIGRTTGFGIRLTLGNGVRFANTTVAPSAGAALTDYNNPTIATPIPTAGSNVLVISVTPDTSAGSTPNIGVEELVTWAAGDLDLINLSALATAGTNVPVTIELFDSNTATVFATFQGASLATSVEGTTVVFDPQAGDVSKRIDVATCGSAGGTTQAARTRFSPSGAIGGSCTAADTDRTEFNAGQIRIGARGLANGFVGANNSGSPDAGNFQYDVANDEFSITVSGTDFSAFNAATGNDRVYLSTSNSCDIAGALPGAANSRVIEGNSSITFEGLAPLAATGSNYFVCFATTVAAATQIAAQELQASVAIDFANNSVIDPADRAGALLPLRNNGTVLEFQNVNPAANARAQSFVRLTNNGSLVCPVTLTGRDDAGVAGASPIRLTLEVGQSLTFNSEDLENGSAKGTGSFGDGTGRWYVTANGECAGLVGSALNRNLETGTVTNLTPDKR